MRPRRTGAAQESTMLRLSTAFVALAASLVAADSYTWKNVRTDGGGGWVGNVVFNPTQKVCRIYMNSSPEADRV
jgi:hypothetical protein